MCNDAAAKKSFRSYKPGIDDAESKVVQIEIFVLIATETAVPSHEICL